MLRSEALNPKQAPKEYDQLLVVSCTESSVSTSLAQVKFGLAGYQQQKISEEVMTSKTPRQHTVGRRFPFAHQLGLSAPESQTTQSSCQNPETKRRHVTSNTSHIWFQTKSFAQRSVRVRAHSWVREETPFYNTSLWTPVCPARGKCQHVDFWPLSQSREPGELARR